MDLEQFRQLLPIFKFKQNIIDCLISNRVLIIAGETGSGKTTQIPQYINERFPNQRIIITQPRRVAAITIAQRVAQEKQCQLGEQVGYSVRFDENFDFVKTKIKYVTDGMLIREFILDQKLSKYNIIIIDEAHERTIQSDLLLALLKKLLQKRNDFKLVVMSATLEIQKISNYFNTQNILTISGRTYPIDIYNTLDRQNDYIESTLDTILQIHFTEESGDILAFLPGQEDIEDLYQSLQERISLFLPNAMKMLVLRLYAALPSEIQMLAFNKTPDQTRKVVLSTNIAETSVTIDGIKFVVDCGLVKIRQFQQQKAIETLLTVPIAQAQAMQRAGRAGRQSRGKCFRLYSDQTFQKLGKFMLPEILRTNLQQVVLQMKAIGIENILKFDFIDQPDVLSLCSSMNQLQQLNALDQEFNLTKYGKDMSQLPLEPQYANLLIKSKLYDCMEIVLDVLCILEVENLIYVPRNSKINVQAILNKFKINGSDHLTKAKILQQYQATKNKKSFCSENYINLKSVKKALEIRQQLSDYMKKMKIDIQMEIECSNDPTKRFIQCITDAMIFKQAYYCENDQAYRLSGSNQLAYIHPESVLFNQKTQIPQYLSFNEVIMTKKVYLRDVTQIFEIKKKLQ